MTNAHNNMHIYMIYLYLIILLPVVNNKNAQYPNKNC